MASWDIATGYRMLLPRAASGQDTERLRELATMAVIRRAKACVKHAASPMWDRWYRWSDRPVGDLDLDASLEAGLLEFPDDPRRLLVRVRERRRMDVALILDMSLSMTGEKIALVAVAAAVTALRLRIEDLGVVAFDSTPRVLKPLGEAVPLRTFVRRVLEVPARGYTHLEAGLQTGLQVLRRSSKRHRAAVLLSDGVYNVGWDPTPVASRFERLHVVHLGEKAQDRGLCRRLAAVGRGRYYRARSWEALPGVAYSLVRDLFR